MLSNRSLCLIGRDQALYKTWMRYVTVFVANIKLKRDFLTLNNIYSGFNWQIKVAD